MERNLVPSPARVNCACAVALTTFAIASMAKETTETVPDLGNNAKVTPARGVLGQLGRCE